MKYGIYAGVGVILYFLLFYFIDKEMMMGPAVSWTSLIITTVFAFLAVAVHRKSNGGYIEFKEGLKTGFLVIVLSNLIFYAFFFIITKSDPELVTILKQQGIDFYKKFATEEQLKDVDKLYENFSFGISDLLLSFAKSTIGGFFIALLPALILKKSDVRSQKS